MLDERLNNNSVLSDIVGYLCAIGDMESVGTKWKKRDIQLFTNFSEKSKVTLWEEFGENFDPYLYNKDSGPYIVIVTSTTVKEFRGEISFSTTSASKIYVNLSIDYVASMIQRFASTSVGIQTLESSNVKNISVEEEMFLHRMNIKELLESDWSSDLEEHTVTVRAKITEIDNYWGWNYVSCNSCARKVTPKDGVFHCPRCVKECKFPLVKYKIHIKVKDDSKDTTFVLLNTVAEKLLDSSAHKLLNRLPLGSDDVPVQIENLCNKDFVFKLKLNSYNLKEGLENFTVSKIFIPDEKLELEYKLNSDKKKKSKLEDDVPLSEDDVPLSVYVKSMKRRIVLKDKLLKKTTYPTDRLLDNLEDSDADEAVADCSSSRKRRTVIIEDDEDTDGDE